LFSV
jgi:hypothetical protein